MLQNANTVKMLLEPSSEPMPKVTPRTFGMGSKSTNFLTSITVEHLNCHF